MRVIRSPHAHARFDVGDLAGLRAAPGIDDVVTAADVPNNRFAIFPDLRDQPVLADGVVRFRGEAVLALVGDEETVMAVDLAGLPIGCSRCRRRNPCRRWRRGCGSGDALHARYPDNVLCRGRVVRGDVDAMLARLPAGARSARLRVRPATSSTPTSSRRRATPRWEGDRVRVFACTQTPYMDRDEVASVLGIAPAQVHIVPSAIGGGFGGKLDLSVQPLLAVAAWKLGRAVRLVYERPESMHREHQAPSGAR